MWEPVVATALEAIQSNSPGGHSLTKPDGASVSLQLPPLLLRSYSHYTINDRKNVLASSAAYSRYLRRRVMSYVFGDAGTKPLPRGFYGIDMTDNLDVVGNRYELKVPGKPALTQRAYRYSLTTRKGKSLHGLLPRSYRGWDSSGEAINAAGDVLVKVSRRTSKNTNDRIELFLINNNAARPISSTNHQLTFSSTSLPETGCAMNANGQVIGTAADESGVPRGFLFDTTHGLRLISEIVDFEEIDMGSATPTCINDGGEILFSNFVIARLRD